MGKPKGRNARELMSQSFRSSIRTGRSASASKALITVLLILRGTGVARKCQSGSDRLRPRDHELSSSNAINPELRTTITVRNRHDPDGISTNDIGDVVRKSAQIDSAISFRP